MRIQHKCFAIVETIIYRYLVSILQVRGMKYIFLPQ